MQRPPFTAEWATGRFIGPFSANDVASDGEPGLDSKAVCDRQMGWPALLIGIPSLRKTLDGGDLILKPPFPWPAAMKTWPDGERG